MNPETGQIYQGTPEELKQVEIDLHQKLVAIHVNEVVKVEALKTPEERRAWADNQIRKKAKKKLARKARQKLRRKRGRR